MQYKIYRVQIEDLCEGCISLCEACKYFKILLEKGNTCGIMCIGYNCNALQFWSGRKLFGPP